MGLRMKKHGLDFRDFRGKNVEAGITAGLPPQRA